MKIMAIIWADTLKVQHHHCAHWSGLSVSKSFSLDVSPSVSQHYPVTVDSMLRESCGGRFGLRGPCDVISMCLIYNFYSPRDICQSFTKIQLSKNISCAIWRLPVVHHFPFLYVWSQDLQPRRWLFLVNLAAKHLLHETLLVWCFLTQIFNWVPC